MLLRAFAFAVLLALAGAARAAPACPGDDGAALPEQPGELALVRDRLLAMTEHCDAAPGYLAMFGAVELAVGRFAEAATLLERAILIDPARPGARLDYALALEALGDRLAARELLADILARDAPPQPLRLRIEARIVSLDRRGADRARDAADAPVTRVSGAIGAYGGRDTNLNSALRRDTLTLTFPDGPLLLAVAPEQRPRAGGAGLLEGQGRVERDLGDGLGLFAAAEGRVRWVPGGEEFNTGAGDALLGTTLRRSAGQWWVFGGRQWFEYGGATIVNVNRLAAGHDWAQNAAWTGACRPRVSADADRKAYPSAPQLDGHGVGAGLALLCEGAAGLGVAQVRAVSDRPVGDRPGGEQRRLDARFAARMPVGRAIVEVDARLLRARDASAYSPLLESGATRVVDRRSLRLEIVVPLKADGWEAVASAEAYRQTANIALFEVRGQAYWLGMRYRYR